MRETARYLEHIYIYTHTQVHYVDAKKSQDTAGRRSVAVAGVPQPTPTSR